MVIKLDFIEDDVATDGNFLALLAPFSAIVNRRAPKVAELASETVIDFTYSMPAGGFKHAATQNLRTSNRLTLAQAIQKPGRQTDTLTTQTVFGGANAVADPAIIPFEKYIIFARYAIDHDAPLAAGQKFDVLPVIAGRKQKDEPAEDGMWTKTVVWSPFGKVLDDVLLVA